MRESEETNKMAADKHQFRKMITFICIDFAVQNLENQKFVKWGGVIITFISYFFILVLFVTNRAKENSY